MEAKAWTLFALLFLSGCLSGTTPESQPAATEPEGRGDHEGDPTSNRTVDSLPGLGDRSDVIFENPDNASRHLRLRFSPMQTWDPYGNPVDGVRMSLGGVMPHGEPVAATFTFGRCLTPLWHAGESLRPWGFSDDQYHHLPPFLLRHAATATTGNLSFGHVRLNYDVGAGEMQLGRMAHWDSMDPFWQEEEPWMMAYHDDWFPARFRQGSSPEYELVRHNRQGEPIAECPPRLAATDPSPQRLQVTHLATEEDPPLPVSLNDAIAGMQASPKIPLYRGFMEAFPEAFIHTWYFVRDYAHGNPLYPYSGDAWIFHVVHPEGEHGVGVACWPSEEPGSAAGFYCHDWGLFQISGVTPFMPMGPDPRISPYERWHPLALSWLGVETLPRDCRYAYLMPVRDKVVQQVPNRIWLSVVCPERGGLVVEEPEGRVFGMSGDFRKGFLGGSEL